MQFKKSKCIVLYLGWNSSMQQSRLETIWLESGFVEKGLGLLVDKKLNIRQKKCHCGKEHQLHCRLHQCSWPGFFLSGCGGTKAGVLCPVLGCQYRKGMDYWSKSSRWPPSWLGAGGYDVQGKRIVFTINDKRLRANLVTVCSYLGWPRNMESFFLQRCPVEEWWA